MIPESPAITSRRTNESKRYFLGLFYSEDKLLKPYIYDCITSKRLREEKEGKISGGIYHRTQIDLTYNSNHIEGSRLTHEQTRYIFETNTIGITEDSINVDDYKRLPNEVGGNETCPPEQVHTKMAALLKAYNAKKEKSLEDIIDLHCCCFSL